MINIKDLTRCTLCPLSKDCSSPLSGFFYDNKTPVELMIVTDRPTAEEDFVMTQFFDRANTYLKNLVEQIFTDSSYYMTYAVKCHNKLSLSKIKKEGTICVSSWFFKELYQINPKIVLCMGEISYELIAKLLIPGLSKYKENIGKSDYILFSKGLVSTWYSPHYLFNGGKHKELQFLKFLKELKGRITC